VKTYVCSVCDHIEFNTLSTSCPVCQAHAEKSISNDRVFEESAEKSKEAAIKHIPVVTVNKKCGLIPEQSCVDITVRIGANLHPMESAHFIQFIDCYVDDNYVSRVALTSKVFAAGCFHLKLQGIKVTIVENCNVHGYWKTDVIL
jgi:desulfoferrodoxin-like iron-binding protein